MVLIKRLTFLLKRRIRCDPSLVDGRRVVLIPATFLHDTATWAQKHVFRVLLRVVLVVDEVYVFL